MAKRRFCLSPEEALELHQALTTCPEASTAARLQAVLLYGSGDSAAQVQARFGCSRSSLMLWCQKYLWWGVAGLSDSRQGGNNAKLSREQIEDLYRRIQTITPKMLFGEYAATPEGNYWTFEDLYRAIKQWYGVIFQSRTSYYKILSYCVSNNEREELLK